MFRRDSYKRANPIFSSSFILAHLRPIGVKHRFFSRRALKKDTRFSLVSLFLIAETGFEPALPTSKSGRPPSLSAFSPRNSRFLACLTFLLLPLAAVGDAAPGTRRSQGIKKRYKIFSCISLFDCGDRI